MSVSMRAIMNPAVWTARPVEQWPIDTQGHQYHGTTLMRIIILYPNYCADSSYHRADSRFAPSQWETALLYNDFSHWLVENLESVLYQIMFMHQLNSVGITVLTRTRSLSCINNHIDKQEVHSIAWQTWCCLFELSYKKLCLENWVHTCRHTHTYRYINIKLCEINCTSWCRAWHIPNFYLPDFHNHAYFDGLMQERLTPVLVMDFRISCINP